MQFIPCNFNFWSFWHCFFFWCTHQHPSPRIPSSERVDKRTLFFLHSFTGFKPTPPAIDVAHAQRERLAGTPPPGTPPIDEGSQRGAQWHDLCQLFHHQTRQKGPPSCVSVSRQQREAMKDNNSNNNECPEKGHARTRPTHHATPSTVPPAPVPPAEAQLQQ